MKAPPKRMSNKAIGDLFEQRILGILRQRSWVAWNPPKAKFRSQDMFAAFDAVCFRAGSRILFEQAGTVPMASAKRRQVDQFLLPLVQKDPTILHKIAPQLWLRESDSSGIRIEEFIVSEWVELGRCTMEGGPVEEYLLPWPIMPEVVETGDEP